MRIQSLERAGLIVTFTLVVAMLAACLAPALTPMPAPTPTPLPTSGSTPSGEVRGLLGEELLLHIGQTAFIADENLKVEFVRIAEDSRCPKGVVCIWAGRVLAEVRISAGDATDGLVLAETGLTEAYATTDYQKYRLSYHVEPYPEQGKTISDSQYRLLLTVSK
jgi:hypothetical protein